MKINKKINIRQSFYYKFISLLKKFLIKISFLKCVEKLERHPDNWYAIETASDLPFRWSHPVTKLNIKNLSKVILCFSDPLGREITILTKGVNETIKLEPEQIYEVTLGVNDADEVTIRTEPFNPEKDTRSLGLQFYYITSKNTIVLN